MKLVEKLQKWLDVNFGDVAPMGRGSSEILEVFHLEMTPFRGRLFPASGQVSCVPRGERVGCTEPQTAACGLVRG